MKRLVLNSLVRILVMIKILIREFSRACAIIWYAGIASMIVLLPWLLYGFYTLGEWVGILANTH